MKTSNDMKLLVGNASAHRLEPTEPQTGHLPGLVLRWAVQLLVVVTWLSGAIFGAYILVFFGGVALGGAAERWNESLPALYDVRSPATTVAIGAHFLSGAVLLLLGPIQLIEALRRQVPALHRWLGRIYVVSAGLAGLGGLVFILGKGTVGGLVMDLGFGLYGALMVLSASKAYLEARTGCYERHRAWAIRLFALTVGSWLYRMEYGFWHLAFGSLGRAGDFQGWFDMIMAFWFYVPNLLLAELFIRARRAEHKPIFSYGAAATLLFASVLLVAATTTFTTRAWGPRLASGIAQVLP